MSRNSFGIEQSGGQGRRRMRTGLALSVIAAAAATSTACSSAAPSSGEKGTSASKCEPYVVGSIVLSDGDRHAILDHQLPGKARQLDKDHFFGMRIGIPVNPQDPHASSQEVAQDRTVMTDLLMELPSKPTHVAVEEYHVSDLSPGEMGVMTFAVAPGCPVPAAPSPAQQGNAPAGTNNA